MTMKMKTKLSQEERFIEFVQLLIRLAKYPKIIASTRARFRFKLYCPGIICLDGSPAAMEKVETTVKNDADLL